MTAKKSEKIRRLTGRPGVGGLDPRYAAYFECFNRGDYYDAHDVLEDLWLEQGRGAADHAFYKGLIQGAGAFVHLQKHYAEPTHPVHGRRLEPAVRLLLLCLKNLSAYPARHLGLDVGVAGRLFGDIREQLQNSHCRENPWRPDELPQLPKPEAGK